MSKEARRKRGAEYAEYKRRREARYEGRKKAREEFTENYRTNQKKVSEIIGAIMEYYGDDNFHRSMWSSEELLDEYERVFVENGTFSNIREEDIEAVNRELKRREIPVLFKQAPQENKIAVDLSDAQEVLGHLFNF